MNEENWDGFGTAALRLAGMAAAALERQLGDPEGDVKKARDLAAILKDMAGLAQQLGVGGAREVTVRFLDETDGCAG